jgi:alpha-L-rhamnosidase
MMAFKIDRRRFLIASASAASLPTVTAVSPLELRPRVRVTGLKVDYLDHPVGLDNARPCLSWQLESDERNVQQSAYRILVGSSPRALVAGRSDLWDSGKVRSSESVCIEYAGRALNSRERYWWTVQVWDERDDAFAASEPCLWEMGLLDPNDWSAQWLAVEDSTAEADRRTGLHWIWGDPTDGKTTRGFRVKVLLPVPAREGALYAVLNDFPLWAQITRIWIDNTVIAGPGRWTNVAEEVGVTESSTVKLQLQPMTAGEHLIAIEVATEPPLPEMKSTLEHGLAVFLRLYLENGDVLRLSSGLSWKTALAPDVGWQTSEYDDTAWRDSHRAPMIHQPWPPEPAMRVRRTFSVDQPIVKARLYTTALGAYEARLNGRRVGDALLTPEVSQYAKRVLYQIYDVTSMVREGDNAIGLTVGDGWYASFDDRYAWALPPRRVLVQLELTLADGSRQVIGTGPDWRIAESPIRESQIKIGEIYDARLDQPGWDSPSFDDTQWEQARIADTPACRLVPHMSPPIRAIQTLLVSYISQPRLGLYVFDFGQNFAGWCRLQVKGASGTRIELKFAELVSPSGEVDQPYMNIGRPKKDVYILKGDPKGETFEPHFTYRGFRYVQVAGLPATPTKATLEGVVVHSDFVPTGKITFDDPLLTQIQRAMLWTERSNFVGAVTDSPSREQRSWLVTAALLWDGATFNWDLAAYTSRYMDNVADDQTADGAFPMMAPAPISNNAMYHVPGSPPGTSDAGIILPWTVWRRYGDVAIIKKYWEPMKRYLQFIEQRNPDYLWRNGRSMDWNEWLSLDQILLDTGLPATPKDLVGTAYWAHSAALLAEMADAIELPSEAGRLRKLSERVRQEFNAAFVKADGTVGSGTQTSYVLALRFNLLPGGIREAAAARLATDIRSRGVSLATGTIGTHFVLDVLTDSGYASLAYDLLLRTKFPSWGYMIREGATTIWETWNGTQVYLNSSGAVEKQTMSRNHPEFASIGGFLFRRIAGIDAGTPGFGTIIVRPILDPRLRRGGGEYDSVRGRISTDWRQHGDGSFSLKVTVPANTLARVHLPATPTSRIQERLGLAGRTDLKSAQRSASEAVFYVGSGSYDFIVDKLIH